MSAIMRRRMAMGVTMSMGMDVGMGLRMALIPRKRECVDKTLRTWQIDNVPGVDRGSLRSPLKVDSEKPGDKRKILIARFQETWCLRAFFFILLNCHLLGAS